MSPFKRPDSPYYYIRPSVPGYGRVGPWSTGTRNLTRARDMEGDVRELAMSGRGDVLELLVAGKVRLVDVWVAKRNDRLEQLIADTRDKPLQDVVDTLLEQVDDSRTRDGLRILPELVSELAKGPARVSWLHDPNHVTDVLKRREAGGHKRNSVRRSLMQGIIQVLDRELGRRKRLEIMRDVKFKEEDDRRNIVLAPEQVGQLLDACDVQMQPIVGLAMLTGIDVSPLLRLQGKHFNEATGELLVPDTKNRTRYRTLALSEPAMIFLRRATIRTGPEELIFPFTRGVVHYRFSAARKAVGLDWLRFKDLRHAFADAWTQAGGSLKELGGALGHKRAETSLRYTGRQPTRQHELMERTAERLGLSRHLQIEKEDSA